MSAYVDDSPADERIVELAKNSTSRLEILWDEVGYTPEEKRRQMEGLIDGFRTLCENKVRYGRSLTSADTPACTPSVGCCRRGCIGCLTSKDVVAVSRFRRNVYAYSYQCLQQTKCHDEHIVVNNRDTIRAFPITTLLGEAGGGREEPVPHFYRRCQGQDQKFSRGSRSRQPSGNSG